MHTIGLWHFSAIAIITPLKEIKNFGFFKRFFLIMRHFFKKNWPSKVFKNGSFYIKITKNSSYFPSYRKCKSGFTFIRQLSEKEEHFVHHFFDHVSYINGYSNLLRLILDSERWRSFINTIFLKNDK